MSRTEILKGWYRSGCGSQAGLKLAPLGTPGRIPSEPYNNTSRRDSSSSEDTQPQRVSRGGAILPPLITKLREKVCEDCQRQVTSPHGRGGQQYARLEAGS